jgi:hypothetical protein
VSIIDELASAEHGLGVGKNFRNCIRSPGEVIAVLEIHPDPVGAV